MTAAQLVFEKGVPIADCKLQNRVLRDRLARVQHVYWQWVKNPFVDVFELFRQLLQGKASDRHALFRMAQRDKMLFEFVKEHVTLSSRKQDEATVRAAANQAIKIGLETDNVNALTKGGKLLFDVAGLDKPESEKMDMSKANFLQPVVTTKASEVDETKVDYNDEQSLQIMKEFGAYIDPKRELVNEKVALIEAKKHEQTGDNEHEQ